MQPRGTDTRFFRQSLFELGNGQWNIPELRRLFTEVLPNATAIIQFRVDHDFLRVGERIILVTARKLRLESSDSTQILVVFEDATTGQKEVDAKDILLAESRHRMKNLIASVKAVARQTGVEGLTGEQFRANFLGRVDALLLAQEFVSSNGSNTALGDLVGQSVKPIAGSRAEVSAGPSIQLDEDQVLPLSMILHELATNALKYGALSGPSGTIHVAWTTELREGHPHLILDWKEEGAPKVSVPEHRGFGTRLIEMSTRAEGGMALFDHDPAGLRVRITLPLKH